MFCKKCGTKIEDKGKFCQSCGTKIESVDRDKKKKLSSITNRESLDVSKDILFYEDDWIRTKYWGISSHSHLDILITKDNFYLIRIPKTHGEMYGLILGFLFFFILGAVAGAYIGNSSDKNKRKKFRSTWINLDHKLISREYENNVFLKIPKGKLKSLLSFQKNKFVIIINGDKKITLRKNKKEYKRFSKFIELYVL